MFFEKRHFQKNIIASNGCRFYLLNISRARTKTSRFQSVFCCLYYWLECLQYTMSEMWYIIFYLFTNILIVFYECQLICSNISISSTIQTSAWRFNSCLRGSRLLYLDQKKFQYCLFSLVVRLTNFSILSDEYFNKVFKRKGLCTQEQTFEVWIDLFIHILFNYSWTWMFILILIITYNKPKFIWIVYVMILYCYLGKN